MSFFCIPESRHGFAQHDAVAAAAQRLGGQLIEAQARIVQHAHQHGHVDAGHDLHRIAALQAVDDVAGRGAVDVGQDQHAAAVAVEFLHQPFGLFEDRVGVAVEGDRQHRGRQRADTQHLGGGVQQVIAEPPVGDDQEADAHDSSRWRTSTDG
jgi:hypothetical protein